MIPLGLKKPAPAAPAALGDRIVEGVCGIVLGKEPTVRLALAAILARGHVLIEDIPGVGKTTLSHALARVLGLSFQRVQFTADLLPGDILGVSVYDQARGRFDFHPGPVFAHVVLADEINRASPRTQSALLEAMEERRVTQDRVTRALPEPFFVLATQNPSHQIGTFALPESQLDRFLMRLELGYPDHDAERALLRGQDRRPLIENLPALTDPETLVEMQSAAQRVHVAEALLDYVRESGEFTTGLSPRAGLGLLAAARAWAFLEHRAQVLPEDVQAVLPGVVGHRLELATDGSEPAAIAPHRSWRTLLAGVPIP
jgi:MoxR-like ATPase